MRPELKVVNACPVSRYKAETSTLKWVKAITSQGLSSTDFISSKVDQENISKAAAHERHEKKQSFGYYLWLSGQRM